MPNKKWKVEFNPGIQNEYFLPSKVIRFTKSGVTIIGFELFEPVDGYFGHSISVDFGKKEFPKTLKQKMDALKINTKDNIDIFDASRFGGSRVDRAFRVGAESYGLYIRLLEDYFGTIFSELRKFAGVDQREKHTLPNSLFCPHIKSAKKFNQLEVIWEPPKP